MLNVIQLTFPFFVLGNLLAPFFGEIADSVDNGVNVQTWVIGFVK